MIWDPDTAGPFPKGVDELPQPPVPPFTDAGSDEVVAEAVWDLTGRRFPHWSDDATAALHALASIIVQAQATITEMVAEARERDYSWDEIATSLGLSPAAARRRYAAFARTRPEVASLD